MGTKAGERPFVMKVLPGGDWSRTAANKCSIWCGYRFAIERHDRTINDLGQSLCFVANSSRHWKSLSHKSEGIHDCQFSISMTQCTNGTWNSGLRSWNKVLLATSKPGETACPTFDFNKMHRPRHRWSMDVEDRGHGIQSNKDWNKYSLTRSRPLSCRATSVCSTNCC